MTQVNFNKENIKGTFTYTAFAEDEQRIVELDWDFGDFETFMYYMSAYINKDFNKVMDGCHGVTDVELKGISFSAKDQDASTRIDMFDDWIRATTTFNLNKFSNDYEDKMKRIMAIIKE